MDGWITHLENLESVLQGEVAESISPGKASPYLESKFYLKGSYG